jgi:hypothetical protein
MLEPSRSTLACTGTALPFTIHESWFCIRGSCFRVWWIACLGLNHWLLSPVLVRLSWFSLAIRLAHASFEADVLKDVGIIFSHSVSLRRNSPTRARTASFVRFVDHTQRHSTVGRTPLDDGSARRRNLYLTTHNTPKRQTPMPPAGFEPAVLPSERPQTLALDRSATGIGSSEFT